MAHPGFKNIFFALLALATPFQNSAQQPHSATVRIQLDHNRIIIPVTVYLPDGNMKQVHAWVDNGTSVMSMTARLAKELEITTTTTAGKDSVVAMPGILVGHMHLKIGNLPAPIEIEPSSSVGSGLQADINLPSTVLHNYDIVIDYPARLFTIAMPGLVHFRGRKAKAFFNPQNYLIQLPASVDSSHFNLALDVGTPVTFITGDLVSAWSLTHGSWPSMTGAIGIANLWGLDDEPSWKLLRVANLSFAGMEFPNMVVVSFPTDRLAYFQDRAGIPTAGLMGAASLLNERVGIDYKNGLVYFERLGPPIDPDMRLIGLTLRPEDDGSYQLLGVASYNGGPSVKGMAKGDRLVKVNGKTVTGLTMGAVWSLLHGIPGVKYTLTIERAGKLMTLPAFAHPFLRHQP